MNIYLFELFLTVMQRDVGDTGWVGGDVEELGKQLSFVIVISVLKSCTSA